MAPLTVIGHLTATGERSRQKLIEKLSEVVRFTEENEPGVIKYCLTIPQDMEDKQSIFVIEEYADQAALDSHIASPIVAAVIKLFASDPTLLQNPPVVHNLSAAASFTRPSISQHDDSYIVFGTLDYKPRTAEQGILGFTNVCDETERNEPGTLSYNILRDKDNTNQIKTLEVYESEKYLWDPHAKSAAVTQNKEANKDIRTNLHLVFLKRVTGYFYK